MRTKCLTNYKKTVSQSILKLQKGKNSKNETNNEARGADMQPKVDPKGWRVILTWEQLTETRPRGGVGGGVNPSLGLRGLELEAVDLHALRHKASAD